MVPPIVSIVQTIIGILGPAIEWLLPLGAGAAPGAAGGLGADPRSERASQALAATRWISTWLAQ